MQLPIVDAARRELASRPPATADAARLAALVRQADAIVDRATALRFLAAELGIDPTVAMAFAAEALLRIDGRIQRQLDRMRAE